MLLFFLFCLFLCFSCIVRQKQSHTPLYTHTHFAREIGLTHTLLLLALFFFLSSSDSNGKTGVPEVIQPQRRGDNSHIDRALVYNKRLGWEVRGEKWVRCRTRAMQPREGSLCLWAVVWVRHPGCAFRLRRRGRGHHPSSGDRIFKKEKKKQKPCCCPDL